METIWSAIIGVLGALATIGSAIALIIKSRGENKNAGINAKSALDARIDQRLDTQLKSAWERLDLQDKKIDEQNIELGKQKISLDNQSAQIKVLEERETRRSGAITRILRDIARQWPSGTKGPDLDPADILEIEETIPAAWIRVKN